MMKRSLALLAVLILVVGLVACGNGKGAETTVPSTAPTTVPTTEATIPTTAPTEPAPTATVGGIDLTGMTAEEAAAALNETAASYKLGLTVNGKKLSISAEELGLKLDAEALGKFLEAAANGTELPTSVFACDRTALVSLLKQQLTFR